MNAIAELSCAFSPARGGNGAGTTIADIPEAFACGHLNPLFVRTYQDAVRTIIRANMEWAEATGRGNRAAKRQAKAEAAQLAYLLEEVHAQQEAERKLDEQLDQDCARHRCMDDDLPDYEEDDREDER